MAETKELKIGDRVIGVWQINNDLKVKGTLQEVNPPFVKNDTDGLLYCCKSVERIDGNTFTFEADIPNNEELADDVEEQMADEVKKRFGHHREIKDYHYALVVTVTV
jgi:hypothetical protein